MVLIDSTDKDRSMVLVELKGKTSLCYTVSSPSGLFVVGMLVFLNFSTDMCRFSVPLYTNTGHMMEEYVKIGE